MSQLDLFGEPAEQTSAPATVLVRSYVRVTRGSGTQAKPPVASCAPQPAKVAPSCGEPIPVPHNGTHTSKSAAKHLEQTGAAGTQLSRVLEAVRASGARGMTREEIHIETGISVASVCGRVNTLLGKGLLIETGETRKSSAGVYQAVVVAKEGKK